MPRANHAGTLGQVINIEGVADDGLRFCGFQPRRIRRRTQASNKMGAHGVESVLGTV